MVLAYKWKKGVSKGGFFFFKINKKKTVEYQIETHKENVAHFKPNATFFLSIQNCTMALKKFLEKKDTLEINILLFFVSFSFKTLLKGAKVRDGSIGKCSNLEQIAQEMGRVCSV